MINAAIFASVTLFIPMAISFTPSTGFVVWSASKKIVTAVESCSPPAAVGTSIVNLVSEPTLVVSIQSTALAWTETSPPAVDGSSIVNLVSEPTLVVSIQSTAFAEISGGVGA